MSVNDGLLDRSADEGARVVALELLAQADDASRRLEQDADEEALHDFRVGVRRLRSALRSFRPWLDQNVSRKLTRRLKKCAKATNVARDVEVQLAWLESNRDRLASRRLRAGLELLAERIERRAAELEPRQLVVRYRRTSDKLAQRLATYVRRVDADDAAGDVSFAGALCTLVGEQLDVVQRRIDEVKDSLDERGVHRARIEAKRLRYLLEPLEGNHHANSRDAVKRLKRLQDVLGELHDTHVFAHEVKETLASAAGERVRRLFVSVYERGATGAALRDDMSPSPLPGLLALVRLLRERRDALFADVEGEWRAGGVEALAAEIRALAKALEARAGGKIERERKYLLAGLPPRAAEAKPVGIDQGWLPGVQLRERVRRVRGPDGERFWRGLKQGAGLSRLENEEETTHEVFEALWPLTEGRRVAKRRHRVQDAGLVWEIDEFTDRDLVLAEVELPVGTRHVALPDWLRPLVQREVTNDPAYRNEALAASPAATDGPPADAAPSEQAPAFDADAPPKGDETSAPH